ncbi:MAG: hypothetical protein ABIH86_06280 [Planctomycetota bacterium]
MKNKIKCVISSMAFVFIININKLYSTETPVIDIENSSDAISLDLAKSLIANRVMKNFPPKEDIPDWVDKDLEIERIINDDVWNNYKYALFRISKLYGRKNAVFMVNKNKHVISLGYVNSLELYDVDNDGHLDILIIRETGSGGMVSQLIYMNVFKNIANKENIETISGESYKTVLLGRRDDVMLLKIFNNRLFLYNGYLAYDDNYTTNINNISDDEMIGEIVFDYEPRLAARIYFQDNIEESQRKKFTSFPLPAATPSSDTATENDNILDMSSTTENESVLPKQLQKPKTNSDISKTGSAKSPSRSFMDKYAFIAVIIGVLLIPVLMYVRNPKK